MHISGYSGFLLQTKYTYIKVTGKSVTRLSIFFDSTSDEVTTVVYQLSFDDTALLHAGKINNGVYHLLIIFYQQLFSEQTNKKCVAHQVAS